MNRPIIQSLHKSYGLIFYEKKRAPRYFEINKILFKFFIYGLPSITLASLLVTLVGFVYFKSLKRIAETKEPVIFSKLRKENNLYSAQIKQLQKTLMSLESKLGQSDSGKHESFSQLNFFKIPDGSRDLTHNPVFLLKNIAIDFTDDKLVINFQLHNMKPELIKKRTGRLFILASYDNSFHFFPNNVLTPDDLKISFINGEFFATSRFRPVKASFSLPKNTQNILFQIIIFSRTGDLIHHEIISNKPNIK